LKAYIRRIRRRSSPAYSEYFKRPYVEMTASKRRCRLACTIVGRKTRFVCREGCCVRVCVSERIKNRTENARVYGVAGVRSWKTKRRRYKNKRLFGRSAFSRRRGTNRWATNEKEKKPRPDVAVLRILPFSPFRFTYECLADLQRFSCPGNTSPPSNTHHTTSIDFPAPRSFGFIISYLCVCVCVHRATYVRQVNVVGTTHTARTHRG